MEFPKDAKMGETKASEMKDLFPNIKISLLTFSVAMGGAYKLPLDIPVELKAGLGVFFEIDNGKTTGENFEQKSTYMTIGTALYLDAKYELFENVRVGLTLMPRLGIYDVYKVTDQDKNTESVSGVKVNFGMPIVLGASYTF